MKHAGIEVRIGRLVVDSSQRAVSTGLSEAIAEALQRELAVQTPLCARVEPHRHAPQAVAQHIAAGVTHAGRSNTIRGRNGAD